ncbi:hypothetical protein PtrM4_143650 [Pyrenophora tritici-repentis]|uniref:RNA-directed DNA polymerase n=1 Tax=Pyrenophora tritici-repentis TaxID=45151 RepID=A0A834VM85_9PLEO|nr:hypothetical protein PtrM4_143650 [Pyrenophora tritici-repentis]
MNPLGARDSPHPEIVELLTEETSRDTRPSTTEHRNPALGVPRFMRETAATMNRSQTLERRASGLPRAHGKNNLFDRDVRIPGRYPSLGHTDSVQQPLDISDDSDDELPTTITTRKKGVAFIDHRADLSSPLGIRYPLMSEQRRYSRQSQAEVDTDYFSEAWLSPGPAASLEPLVEHAYERAQFERQPSTSYVIPREDNVTTFDLWENDAQGNPQRKDSLHTTPIGHTNNDQSKALNRLYDQIRDMWRDLGNERKHSDQLGEQLLARDKVIENLHSKDQETQDILEGYKGDVADTQAVLKNCQDQLQSSVATAQNQAENLAARKSAYKDKYRQEHDAHRATLENMKKLQAKLKQATAKVSSPLPALSRQGQRGTQSTKNRYSDDEEYDHRRHPRPKKPEPEAFSGNGTTSADYLKWKMDVTDWFADYPYEFASETKKLSYIRQKTKDKAFGCLQHGYLEPGAEFAHSNEAWSILDSVYKSLNTSIEAQSWYESLNSTMKPTESMGEYIARFNVGTSALRWPDTLKIQFMRNRLPVWWRDMTAMKVLESSLTYLDFCQTLRLLEQSNPQRATTTGNRRGNQSLEGGGGGGAGGNKSTPSNGPRNGGSSSGSGPRGRSDIQVKVLRHLNRCFNCLKKNHTFKATGGYCSKEPVASFDSYPEVQDALEKAIANNGVPVGEPARPKVKGAAASGPPRHEKPPPVQPPAHPLIPPAPSVEDSEEEEELHPNRFVDDSLTLALSPTVEVSSDDESDPDPTLQAIANRVKALKQQSQTGSRITVSAIAAAAIRGDKYQPLVGQQLVFKGIISSHRSSPQHVEIMGDTGCASLFIDSSHARAHKYDLISLSQPATLELADGSLVAGVTHMARVTVTFGTHTEDVLAYVTKLSGVQMILGTPWFQTHEPRVNWKDMSLSFDSEHCLINCIHDHRPCHTQSSRHHKQPLPQVPDPCRKVARHPKAPPPIDVAFISSRVAAAAVCHDQDICITSYDEIGRIAELSDKEWEDTQHLRAAGAKVLPEDYEKFRDKMERPHMTRQEILKRLPKVLHPLYQGFDPKEADELPELRGNLDHKIELKLDDTGQPPKPSFQRLRPMSRDEARAVKLYVDDMIKKGHVERSTSAWAAPLLVVRKPGGGIRICVDYRGLNAHTVKNRNAPPLIRDMLAKLSKSRYFSKVDVIAAFNKIRIKEEHKHLSAFITPYGLYQYTVMPFGMCNSPGTFQAYINDVLHEYLDEFCMAYLDDVIIFSETLDQHEKHLVQVVSRLADAGLPMDILKSDFITTEVKFLGLIITADGIKMDPDKVSAIQDWKLPQSLKDVQAFLGFANFYRRFIRGFSDIAKPLTHLTKGDPKLFKMTKEAERSFLALKVAFCSDVVLAHFDPDLKTIVETDASDYVYAAVLSQVQPDGSVRPVAYLSKKMSPTECNYEIYDKELLAIVRAFEEWRPELAGVPEAVEVLTDHRGLEYFRSKRNLNRRQARWAEFLEEFDFRIQYRPGKQGTKPDSLTRRTGDLPDSVTDDRVQHQCQTILGSNRWGGSYAAVRLAGVCLGDNPCDLGSVLTLMQESGEGASLSTSTMLVGSRRSPLDDVLLELCLSDPRLRDVKTALASNDRRIPHYLIAEGIRMELADLEASNDGKLFIGNGRLVVPFSEKLRTRIIAHIHNSLPGGHGGRTTTYQQVSQWYYWQGMTNTIARFTNNCLTCKRSKVNRTAKHSLLHPLPVPTQYWDDISIDFITPLPKSTWCGHSYQHIMVVVDRLSKMKKFIAMENLEVPTVVDKFMEYIWKEEGYPRTLVSDRGRQFTSHFWNRLCAQVGTHPKLSTSHHPETDGQTENANADLKQYLRAYVNYLQTDWAQLLPLAEFEANSAISTATGLSPFLATKGRQPRSGLEPAHLLRPLNNHPTIAQQQRNADALAQRIDTTRTFLRQQILWAQDKMKEFADANRYPAPRFDVGDWVMLNARHIKTERPVKSLDHKNIGPYQ